MYRCDRCGGEFAAFETPGQCPLCLTWADVRCANCGHTDAASVFTGNGDRCPKCNATVSPSGATPAQRFSLKDFVTGMGCLLLLTSCWFLFTLGQEVRLGHWWAVLVEAIVTAGAIAALYWGLKDRATGAVTSGGTSPAPPTSAQRPVPSGEFARLDAEKQTWIGWDHDQLIRTFGPPKVVNGGGADEWLGFDVGGCTVSVHLIDGVVASAEVFVASGS